MSSNSENIKEKVSGSIGVEKPTNDTNKDDEKADLVNNSNENFGTKMSSKKLLVF